MILITSQHKAISTVRMYITGNETPFGKTQVNNTAIPLKGHTMS